mgnify:FL=1
MPTQKKVATKKDITPLYAEAINMMEGVADKCLEENPNIVSLFEIDVVEMVSPYVTRMDTMSDEGLKEPDTKVIAELHHPQEAMEREMEASQRVKP